MDSPKPERKLAAILAADVVGYSRLMHLDDQATLRLLNESRALFAERVATRGGRIVNAPGDSVLAEFTSVVQAVECAVEMQQAFLARNQPLAQAQRMRYRMGVNLGDVLVDESGVYGDGVNVAARLEGLCEPGGVAISASAYEQVRDRIALPFLDAGEHSVKNIARPVHVYRINLDANSSTAPKTGWNPLARLGRWAKPALALGLVIVLGGTTLLFAPEFIEKSSRALLSAMDSRDASESTLPAIAVLPFANQSGDPQRDYFSDGITEDIINALGRFSGIRVASNSAIRAYKGQPTDPAKISRDLGVRYIAQGSVRQADGKLRISVELSDASKGLQLWSERFEGAGQQVFEMQDQVVKNIVGALAVKLTTVEQKRVFAKPTENLEAYDLVLRARSLISRTERVSNREARNLLAQAVALSPNYPMAQIAIADADYQQAILGWVENSNETIARSESLALKASNAEDPDARVRAHGLLGSIYTLQGNYDRALIEVNRALELNGSEASAYASRGGVLLWQGRIDEAIRDLETALRFDPHMRPAVQFDLAFAQYMAGQYWAAVTTTDRGLARSPTFHNFYVIRAMALAELGDAEGTRLAAEQIKSRFPFFQVAVIGSRFANPANHERVQASLRKAGF